MKWHYSSNGDCGNQIATLWKKGIPVLYVTRQDDIHYGLYTYVATSDSNMIDEIMYSKRKKLEKNQIKKLLKEIKKEYKRRVKDLKKEVNKY